MSKKEITICDACGKELGRPHYGTYGTRRISIGGVRIEDMDGKLQAVHSVSSPTSLDFCDNLCASDWLKQKYSELNQAILEKERKTTEEEPV
jgi:hypothetical protein